MGVTVETADATMKRAENLSPKQRRILVLWLLDYDCREIAERERCSKDELQRIINIVEDKCPAR
jgi:DNA-binding CsgD family transcriptional regulator